MAKAEKRKVGAPTKYQTEYAEQARKLCLLGATDKDMAEFFGVVESTINEWKLNYPEFSESIKEGKELADSTVAEKLFQRATGYQAPDVDIKVINNEIVETPLTKHYPPDVTAAIFWLKNRQKAKWRDTHSIDHSGNLPLVPPTINVIASGTPLASNENQVEVPDEKKEGEV